MKKLAEKLAGNGLAGAIFGYLFGAAGHLPETITIAFMATAAGLYYVQVKYAGD